MTPEQLIAEGRKIQPPCAFLRTKENGEVAAVWYERDEDEIESTGFHCWLTIDARQTPGLPPSVTGYLSIFTNEANYEGGWIEVTQSWPNKEGTKLYAHAASVLPAISALFLRGGEIVGDWLQTKGWQRDRAYTCNFKDEAVTGPYWDVVEKECPLYYNSDVYAVLGGWHVPMNRSDLHELLLSGHLMVLTLRDSEPWVEAWRTNAGEFKVFQTIT